MDQKAIDLPTSNFELLHRLDELKTEICQLAIESLELDGSFAFDWIQGATMGVDEYESLCRDLEIAPSMEEAVLVCSGRSALEDPSDLSGCVNHDEKSSELQRVSKAFEENIIARFPGSESRVMQVPFYERIVSEITYDLRRGGQWSIVVYEQEEKIWITLVRFGRWIEGSNGETVVRHPFTPEAVYCIAGILRKEWRESG